MRTKHTKGEWTLEYDHSIVMKNQVVAQTIAPDGCTNEERVANAKLIAAAPELLDALVSLKDYCQTIDRGEGWDEILSKTFKAIEKATK